MLRGPRRFTRTVTLFPSWTLFRFRSSGGAILCCFGGVDAHQRLWCVVVQYCSQSDGQDRDVNGVKADLEARKHRPRTQDPRNIELGAIYNSRCTKVKAVDNSASTSNLLMAKELYGFILTVWRPRPSRSEEHTSELQSLMRIS